ncbi:pilus assembly protein TadG-related protein [Actinomadura rupiterrae]|uniref:pilus assembly protein TadG-related protein n=1 Tax=Actinomadura rupiterrae TaxID=559627 RepID=UPI0020A3C972|nr:pilus assembly protein TadG-related protein [Actinomadura rupiterrae]MCP2335232.1 hypothetical protein [Actinomadura rupiterrae]
MTPPRSRRDAGSITAFAMVMTAALVMCIGLVLDGGLVLAARIRALGQAQEAARAGAQAIDLTAYRQRGIVILDPARAADAARAYLTAAGLGDGQVQATGHEVTVTLTRTQHLQILRIVGLGSITVHATGRARPAHGITRELR